MKDSTKMVTDKMNEELKRKGYPKTSLNKTFWVVNKFIYYALMSAIHGYHVTERGNRTRFTLKYKYMPFVPFSLRKKYRFSPKAFGYLFFIDIESENMKREKIHFHPAVKWKKEIYKLTHSDHVYKMIQDEKN